MVQEEQHKQQSEDIVYPYDRERVRALGRADALGRQAAARATSLVDANDSPKWRQILLEDAQRRDQLRALGDQGDMAAAKQADYLDGYLSVWD